MVRTECRHGNYTRLFKTRNGAMAGFDTDENALPHSKPSRSLADTVGVVSSIRTRTCWPLMATPRGTRGSFSPDQSGRWESRAGSKSAPHPFAAEKRCLNGYSRPACTQCKLSPRAKKRPWSCTGSDAKQRSTSITWLDQMRRPLR